MTEAEPSRAQGSLGGWFSSHADIRAPPRWAHWEEPGKTQGRPLSHAASFATMNVCQLPWLDSFVDRCGRSRTASRRRGPCCCAVRCRECGNAPVAEQFRPGP